MLIDPDRYEQEMQSLVESACAAYLMLPQPSAIYTASIWTDPNAAVSAVSFDTADNSRLKVAALTDWVSAHPLPVQVAMGERNANPADFKYRDLAICRHDSFPQGWETASFGECWDILEPLIRRVAMLAVPKLAELPRERDALLGVNSRWDWFDEKFLLQVSTT